MAGSNKFDWRTLVGGLSAALPSLANERASRAASRDLAAGQNAVYAAQNEADRALGEEVTALARSGPAAEESAARAAYTQAINTARAAPRPSMAPNVGGARYRGDVATAKAQNASYGTKNAATMAAIDAPGRQRANEGYSAARVASGLSTTGRRAAMEAFLARLQAQRRQPSPWASILSDVGGRIAQNYGGVSAGDGLEEIDLSTLPKRV